MIIQKPRALLPGTTIAVVAPAGPAPDERVEKGLDRLRSLGFETQLYPYSAGPRSYLAGSDSERAQAFSSAYSDSGNAAVWCLRGGFGSARMLDHLTFEQLRQHRKVLIGFSDISALLLAFTSRVKQVTFHGPVLTQMGDLEHSTCEKVMAMLAGTSERIDLHDERRVYRPGCVEGPLVGGNLSILCSLIGTPYFPDLSGTILFLEDVGEPPYRLDRMLNQLRQSGSLSGVCGVALGDFNLRTPKDIESAEGLWQELASWIDGPVVTGLPCGHYENNLCIPLGIQARLDSDSNHVALLEPAVQ